MAACLVIFRSQAIIYQYSAESFIGYSTTSQLSCVVLNDIDYTGSLDNKL